ncbi:uncharacterized protein F4822DRAFT_441708 [Hypoxylon trugodes]|uniref:uncharacterized protein n=1 Tax=Hypoxylon trugodes TaxID=326681 RepID=UPI00219FD773|nr:uncharacterized protein F4822DRAFT_441708 [Hypoxylon trugodes]KAI1392973.1 hypothetical protein F4822DRAFT_441708 [Hypoxylon trugodes]
MTPVNNDIAIVGLSFRLPQGVNDVSSFWNALETRRDLMTGWPDSRISNGSFESNSEGNVHCRGGYFVKEDPGAFDAPFFSLTAKEAASMDPMQRWTLEATYHAFENAGIPAERFRGSQCGVFSASMTDDYKRMIAQDPDNVPRMAVTGTFASILPNRVSWYFDLHGPSIHVDTACSSSLLALDLACQALRSGEASSAVVTGSNLILGPTIYQMLSSLNFLSPDSRCYSFDHRANGYARGEGVVALVLEPLWDAVQNGDMIRAVIRSTGSNQDGRTPGLTQPSPQAQEELIRRVYKKADLPFGETRYFEAHGWCPYDKYVEKKTNDLGTGTPVGDPMEMKAIGKVFRSSRSAEDPIYVGSVKTNIGHLEGSSGLAGVLKCILILEKGIIPANANFEKINPNIDVDFYHIKVPSENIPWPCEGVRRVSVNSFGFGGSNAHVILDDAFHYLQDRRLIGNHCTVASRSMNGLPISNGTSYTNGVLKANGVVKKATNGNTNGNGGPHSNGNYSAFTTKLLVWSAADEKALKRMIEEYRDFYKGQVLNSLGRLDDLAFTLSTRRSHMLWRTFAVAGDGPHNRDVDLEISTLVRSSAEVGVAFVFTGQGAQYADMGSGLLKYPLFEATLHQIEKIYHGLGCKWSVFDELHNEMHIDRPEYSQPLSTAIQIGLIELLKSFGINPKAVVGHSSGEIAAAYAIGALSLPSACKVSYIRGQLAGKLKAASSSPECMISVNLPEDEVQGYLRNISAEVSGEISIACINSPLNCTLAGKESAIDIAKKQFDEDGIFAQKLKTGVAYHSPSMSRIAEDYLRQMGSLDSGNIKNVKSSIPMVSSVTGQTIRPAVLGTPQYWVDNMVSPVMFSDAIHLLTQKTPTLKVGIGNITDLIEVGPHPALRRPIQDTLAKEGNKKQQIRYTYALHRTYPEVQTILELVGRLHCHGHEVSIPDANQGVSNLAPRRFLVNCPEYPFDHSKTYWAESRLSRDFRLRKSVEGETLGARSFDWNPLEPRWRNFLSIETMPWIGDHVISGTVIYPAAGMLVMAMEAVRHMCSDTRLISGYYIKEAHFVSPILVKEAWEDKTETMLHLHPIKMPQEKESSWSDVTIYAYRNDNWTECFNARIQVELGGKDLLEERRRSHKLVADQFIEAEESCTRPIDSQMFYEDAIDHGLGYGEAFQVVEDIQWDGKTSTIARVDISKWKTTSLVHPVVLDSALHVLCVSTTLGLSLSNATNVPVQLFNGWFSPSGWQQPHTHSIRYLATSNVRGSRESEEGSVYAIADDGSILCAMRRLMTAAVSKKTENQPPRKLLHRIDWKPQLSLMEPHQLVSTVGADTYVRDENDMMLRNQKLKFVLDRVACRTVKLLSGENREKVPESQKRHIEWLERYVKSLDASRATEDVNEVEIEGLLQEIETIHPPWKLHTTVVRHLTDILTGVVDPLEIIFGSDIADVFYADMFEHVCDDRMSKFLDLATHENPTLRILEVGAGTGGMTSRVLAALQELEKRNGGLRFSEYTYTDVSPAFFEKASARWDSIKERVTFKTFDMKRSPESQGFDPSSYDLVVAGSVLHATEDLLATMKNVRKLLKETGHLLLLEVVATEDIATNFTFGLVPGWWGRREEWRGSSPGLPEKQWDEVLRWTGFSGNELILRDYPSDACHIFSIIVSKAVQQAPDPPKDEPKLVLIVDESDEQTKIASSIQDTLAISQKKQSRIIPIDRIGSANLSKSDIVVCIIEMSKPFLATLTEERFGSLQEFLRMTQKLLWVTLTSPEDEEYSQYSVVGGCLRSLRHEEGDKHIVTLAIEYQGETKAEYVQYIAKAYRASFESQSEELEYIVRKGQFTTGRVAEDIPGNQTLQSLLHPQVQHKPLSQGPALKLDVDEPGKFESLHLVEDAKQMEFLPHEVEIEAKSWSLDQNVLGPLGDKGMGLVCSGIVTRVFRNYDPDIQVGDRVCMVSAGCMRTHPRALDKCVVKIPDGLSFEAAASALIPGMTAHHSIDIARLEEGEKILIHSAASSTGQMAIGIANARGAEIFATVGSDKERQLLKKIYHLSDDHILSSRDNSFALGVSRMTNGYGVDVALSSLSGESLSLTWECIASFGRVVDLTAINVKANLPLSTASFVKNVSYSAVDLHHIIIENPGLTSKLLRAAVNLLAEGIIEPPRSLRVYPISRIHQAFGYYQESKGAGNVVLNIKSSDTVPQHLVELRPWKFDENATYVIAGGSGGLGRAIMEWMAERGGKHFIVPSRSGNSKAAIAELISRLRKRGVEVLAPKCDVSSAESLGRILEECSHTMPPIKGCINAAMVLQDAAFNTMKYSQWDITMKSKVQSSINLHKLLPKHLDFFILLSSLNGVCGALAQSNYAGGCSFQDALARYRVAQGQKGVSMDIGWMRNIGIVAETQLYQRQRKSWDDMERIDGKELLALLTVLCDPSTRQMDSQVLFGLRTPAHFLTKGQIPPPLLTRPLFAPFSHIIGEVKNTSRDRGVDVVAAFREATDTGERIQIVIRALTQKLARSMEISPDDVELNKPLSSYGVDSLMALELRNWIGRDFQASVAVFDIMGTVPIAAIGDSIVAKSSVGKGWE